MRRTNRQQATYEELFVIFSSGVERWLKRLLLALLAVTLLAQSLLQLPEIRYLLTHVEKREGTKLQWGDHLHIK